MLHQTIPTARPSAPARAAHLRTPAYSPTIRDADPAPAPAAPPPVGAYGLLITGAAPLPAPAAPLVAGIGSASPPHGPPAGSFAADHFSLVALCVTVVLVAAIVGAVVWKVGVAGAGKKTTVGLDATARLGMPAKEDSV